MAVVRTEDLTKTYDDLRALDGLDLSVESGELFGLLGPNGAGKTTTISILTGQLTPDAGSAEVLGVDPVADPVETRRKVGILPEQETPPSFLTPREYFEFVGAVRDLDPSVVERRVAEWAERLGFAAKLDTVSTDLSRGQQQKVMITAAFLHRPDLVFIDEPLANLDPIVQERVKSHLADYREAGNTVFLSTHHIEVAEELCTRVGFVSRGRLVDERLPDRLDDGESLLDAFLDSVDTEASRELATAP
ncbi:MAG: ABC transporter ATP-binding protein [Halobacteriales archaeon]